MTLRSMHCCGLRELDGLEDYNGDPAGAMKEFFRVAYHTQQRFNYSTMEYDCTPKKVTFSHVIFSEAKDGWHRRATYGQEFVAFIKRNNLGHVAASIRRVNPNSDNPLKVWIWTINKAAVKTWGEKHP